MIVVCSENCTKHINILCGQKAKIFNANPGSIYSNHLVLIGKIMNEKCLRRIQLELIVT